MTVGYKNEGIPLITAKPLLQVRSWKDMVYNYIYTIETHIKYIYIYTVDLFEFLS